MKKYLAILRGINVGGRRKLLMADLRGICEDLGWLDTKTYIQSGNVLFSSKKKISSTKEAKRLENVIKEQFDFDVPVIIIAVDELEQVANANPFIKSDDFAIKQLHMTFLGDSATKSALKTLKDLQNPPDQFHINGSFIYLKIITGYSKTKLTNTFFEKKLGVKATSRNWKTVSKILELAKD